MDLLKRELERKRRALAEDFGGKKLLKRSEIEKKRLEKLRSEETLELTSKSKSKSPIPIPTPKTPDPTPSTTTPTTSPPPSLVLPKHEVIRRLRFLKQPVTLFGEDDDSRLDRLRTTLKSGVLETDSDMTEGQTNDFLKDIHDLKKRQKAGGIGDREEEDGGGEDGDGGRSEGGASSGMEDDKDLKRMKADFDGLCDEDKILVFFKRLLNEWDQELREMPDGEKRTAKGKSMVATFKQCARYLSPLFKFCRKKVLPDDLRHALLVVVKCCMKRDYLAAMDQYIKMAIGNAPWPIGVTMVGIHERSAREKIHTNSVAHIMNDETTRKYLQSVKRLMTFCQRRYPAYPSKSVEFNSLANGSDLQSLLVEEKAAGRPVNEERLRLLTAPRRD